jgi:WD40 repeat protein
MVKRDVPSKSCDRFQPCKDTGGPIGYTFACHLRPTKAANSSTPRCVFIRQDQVLQRSFAQERLSSLAATRDGRYLAAGGGSGTLYVWDVASGQLLRAWPAHYKVGQGKFVEQRRHVLYDLCLHQPWCVYMLSRVCVCVCVCVCECPIAFVILHVCPE